MYGFTAVAASLTIGPNARSKTISSPSGANAAELSPRHSPAHPLASGAESDPSASIAKRASGSDPSKFVCVYSTLLPSGEKSGTS